MTAPCSVLIHPSQFPAALAAELPQALRSRRIDPKFHYLTQQQARRWLAVHQAWSPARKDVLCQSTYQSALSHAATLIGQAPVHVVGLGCGGGQKDRQALQQLKAHGARPLYTPVDVSLPLVLTARTAAEPLAPVAQPIVCDLLTSMDLDSLLQTPEGSRRVLTFFGLLPNFEPDPARAAFERLLRPGDLLLLSANLAPGDDYQAGVRLVLPQYDNSLTNAWLSVFLTDLGFDLAGGSLHWEIEDAHPLGLKRLVAHFTFTRSQTIELEQDQFEFASGTDLSLFFSYRYTPSRLRALVDASGLVLDGEWIAPSGEEGVFLVRRG